MNFRVGEDVGDYKIIAFIGGSVYQVEHHLTKRKEAAKILSTELASDVQIHRFEREIALQAQLNHPNLATLHNAFRWHDSLVLVMEFLEGRTLEQLLREGLSIDDGVSYIRQMLAALSYAHARGVVHRDVNPSNLIITEHGVKLTDFGVSKCCGDVQITNCGDILGNLDYMAPELARGSAHLDRRSDLYSAGAMLYEILTGAKPFGAGRKFGPMVMDSEPEPRRPSEFAKLLAPQWDEVVAKALMRDRDRRYSSASEFLAAIDQVLPARPAVSLSDTIRRWRFRIAGASIAAGIAILPVLFSEAAGVSQVAPLPMTRFHIPAPQLDAPASRGLDAAAPAARATLAHRQALAPAIRTNAAARPAAVSAKNSLPAGRQIQSAPQNPAPAEAAAVVDSAGTEPEALIPTDSNETRKSRLWGKLNPFKKKAPAP